MGETKNKIQHHFWILVTLFKRFKKAGVILKFYKEQNSDEEHNELENR